eukprot:XP_001701604.1 predicted protein [Chlamydomonas reinhardtii]
MIIGEAIVIIAQRRQRHDPYGIDEYLYVWAGPQDKSLGGKDSLFVISLAGTEYGQVVNIVATPYAGIEPHHCRVSLDKKVLGCGGLLSPLVSGPSVVFFDISNPRVPKMVDAAKVQQPQYSAFADEFITTPDGGFLATMMGSSTGGSPGRVVKYDKNFNLLGEYPTNVDGLTGFNPHAVTRTTVRLWDMSDMSISETIDASALGVNGPMDAVPIAETGAFYFGGGNGNVYYLDSAGSAPHTPVVAWDSLFGSTDRSSAGCIIYSFRSGTRLLVSSYVRNQVQLLDTTNPKQPKLLDILQFPTGAGAHVVRLSEDESFGAVATYFLDETLLNGLVRLPGDRTVRMFFLNDKASKFVVPNPGKSVIDFKTLMGAQGKFQPHGVAIL